VVKIVAAKLAAKLSLLSPLHSRLSSQIMDAFWSIFGMPIGVALCFGPAMVVWWFTKDSEPGPDDSGQH
jgi:hypothetical protein